MPLHAFVDGDYSGVAIDRVAQKIQTMRRGEWGSTALRPRGQKLPIAKMALTSLFWRHFSNKKSLVPSDLRTVNSAEEVESSDSRWRHARLCEVEHYHEWCRCFHHPKGHSVHWGRNRMSLWSSHHKCTWITSPWSWETARQTVRFRPLWPSTIRIARDPRAERPCDRAVQRLKPHSSM